MSGRTNFADLQAEPIVVQEETAVADVNHEGGSPSIRALGTVASSPSGLLQLPPPSEAQLRDAVETLDDDYSTDSSLGSRPQQQQQHQYARPPSRRRRPSRLPTFSDSFDTDMRGHTCAHPEVYRHSSKRSEKDVWSHSLGLYPSDYFLTGTDGVASVSLEVLVKYSSIDLLLRAWSLVPAAAKHLTFPPFSQLPELPDILNVRHPDTDLVARFMRLTALDMARRHTFPSAVFLRSTLVRATASAEAKKAEHASFPVHLYSEESICARWEDECSNADEDDHEDESSFYDTVIPLTDVNHVNPLDWAMALLTASMDPRVPYVVLRSLHHVVDRCGINSSSATLQSCGFQRLIRILLIQTEREASHIQEQEEAGRQSRSGCENAVGDISISNSGSGSGGASGSGWLASAITLLFKLVLASKKIDTLLSLLRWVYRHQELASRLPLKGFAPWITCLEVYARPRMRLPFPVSWMNSYDVPLAHSLGLEFSRNIVAVCAVSSVDGPHAVIIANKGIYKLLLKPPYTVIGKNEESTVSECRGVFLEADKIVVHSKHAGVVTFYDVGTLQLSHVLEVCEPESQHGFQVYQGMDRFVTPHYYHDKLSPLYPYFDSSVKVEGVVEPSFLPIPSGTNSLSVQFFLCILPTHRCTSLELVRVAVAGKTWISVRISLDSRDSTVSIVFQHGDDEVVAEVREPTQEGWVLWSATLIPANNAAMWSVYKNGLLVESTGRGGVLFKPSALVASISFLDGTFSGFISGFQIWHRCQTIAEILFTASGKLSNATQNSLLCSFKMNEGVGCCFRSASGTHTWRGRIHSWCIPQKTFRERGVEESEVIPYVPSGDYHIVTNAHESAIVEKGFCTWIDANGRVLEQQFMSVRPDELYFYCTQTSRMYNVGSEKGALSILRWVQTNTLPTKYVKELKSVNNGVEMCEKVVGLATQKLPHTPIALAHYLLHRLNASLLTDAMEGINAFRVAQLFTWNRASPETIGRLVDMCKDLLALAISSETENKFVLMLLCICGRLLTRQLSWLGRGCPPNFVSIVVDMYEKICEKHCEPHSFLAEAKKVFSRLHRVFLVECVSHDYRLTLIMEANKLTDVKYLLAPEHLPPLVASVIEKDLKKPFMSFLNQLKEECYTESELALRGTSTPFRPSSALLSTLLGILSQKKKPRWHSVCVALLNSLCKGILRIFNRVFPSTESAKPRTPEQLDVLKHTSIGIVVFPIAHLLLDLEVDSRDAVNVLTMLNETREVLASYAPIVPPQYVSHSFTETHRILLPGASTHKTVLDLRHARGIDILHEHPRTEETPQVQVSLLTNECKRVVNTMGDRHLVLDGGGQLEILSTPTGTSKDTVITISVGVEIRTESTHWIRDICFALSHAILRITHQLLLTHLPDSILLPRESLFRGGLSYEVLKHHLTTVPEERLLDRTDQTELIQFCNGAGELFAVWQAMYAKRRIPYQERLEPILRSFCAAQVWHSHRQRNISLQKLLEDSLDVIRRKSFLILEVLQQKGETCMLERANFLLKMVNPRARLESIIAEHQQTEVPITGVSPSVSTPMMPNVRSSTSIASISHDGVGSQAPSFMRYSGGGKSNLSILPVDGVGNILRPRNALLGAGAISEGIRSSPEKMSSQVLNFLLYGYNGLSNEEIISALVRKTQQATIHTAAYKLQEELCVAHQSDENMAWSIVSSHLLYRELAHLQHGKSKNDTDDAADRTSEKYITSSRTDMMDCHYIEPMIGCGFQRELELQKASCSFVHTVIQQNLMSCYEGETCNASQNGVGVISLCTLLCHPWDSVDMSIIRPAKIFCVLKKYIFSSLDDTTSLSPGEQNEKDIWWSFVKKCGILGLLYRSVIIPNTLQPSAEKVSIVEGDTLGVLIEDTDICCLARNHWRALKDDTSVRNASTERDCFANYLSGSIVADMPEILYFEVTLELILSEQALVLIGVSGSSLSSTESAGKDTSVAFCSDGVVKHGRTSVQFGKAWSVGDVIGCGVMAPFNSVFYTCNGEFLGIATKCTFNTMMPFVAAQAQSTLVKLIVNFGEHTPFKFDIASLHSSCRTQLISPAMLSDTAFITAHYLVTLCFKNLLRHEKSESTVNEDSVCVLLEEAAGFLRESVLDLLRRLKHVSSDGCVGPASGGWNLQSGSILLARLFRTVNIVIDCFRFSAVTHTTHLEILRLCSVTLIDAHDRWAKMRAARCLGNAARTLRQDYFGEAVVALRRFVTQEVIVSSLSELARTKIFREREFVPCVPLWVGGKRTVLGKGAFHGASPMPSKGRHMVGFRIHRRQQEGRGVGAPLGGCYYVGLTHGHPSVSNMANLINRDDVYVLQDTDDQDQVPHLLLRRHCIPRSSQRRIYGNDETVWVELNADMGEITYYRDKMVPIGLAFANLPRVDDLYPFVFHFNEDASCELIQAPTQAEDPCELLLNGLRRSVAIHALQQLHTVPYFNTAVSEWICRFLSRSHQNLENCLVALAVLGGEKSYVFSQHETHGAVVVEAISDIASKAVVHLEADGDMRLFSTDLSSLKPSFIKPPLFSLSETESLQCCKWLLAELCRSLYEASEIVPFMNSEEEQRRKIEGLFLEVTANTINSDYMGLLSRMQEVFGTSSLLLPDMDTQNAMLQSTSASIGLINGQQPVSRTPVTIDKCLSSPSLFTPNPSVGVTTSDSGYSVVRGNLILQHVFSFAVSITLTANKDALLYVGVSSETEIISDPSKVALCAKTWALCSHDTVETNSINCCVGPGMIFSAEHILFDSGDVVVVQVDCSGGTVSVSRIRNGRRVDFGVLFDNIPSNEKLRPFVLTGPESVVIFSFLDCRTFPARNIFPRSSINGWSSNSHSMRCTSCEAGLSELRYDGEGGLCLCHKCFSSWQHPSNMFCLSQIDAPLPDYLVSRHSPKELLVGGIVEFIENTVFTWSLDKSVNVDVNGGVCMAREGAAFATLEPFTTYGNQRVDISLGHVAGVDGFSFGGLHPFTTMWRVGNTPRTSCTVESDTLLVSSTIIPHGTKVVLGLRFVALDKNQPFNAAGLYVGVTNLLNEYETMNATELENRIANRNIWGTWCDARSKISSSFTVYFLIDMIRGAVMVSSSLLDLHVQPVVVTCNCRSEDEMNLRVVIFSYDRCHVTSADGFVSSNDGAMEGSSSLVGIGLIPENSIDPEFDVMASSCFLFDTVARTLAHTGSSWVMAPLVQQEDTGVLFSIGDTITVQRENDLLAVYRNGLVIATHNMSRDMVSRPQRLVVYLSTYGMVATIVPPLYGKSHLGKIVQTFGMDVGLVECMCPCPLKRRYVVRRRDVRFCALAADSSTIEVGLRVAFKAGSFNLPMRGTVTSTENNTVSIRDEEDRRTWFSVDMGNIFLLNNEGPDEVCIDAYSLLTPPSGTVTRVFEVGKTKYRLQRNGSYNGIMFDVQTKDMVVLTGLAVMTHTTGRHRVEVFFKKGSHHTHEHDSTAWTRVFSNFVGMRSERQFSITFPGIHVEANTTFALYINATHNCGVGHYSKEDGCSGAISNKMDSDDTLTVLVGRTSESSTPFTESSCTPRGFCGSIMYMQNRDTRSPLMNRKASCVEALRKSDGENDNFIILKSHPGSTCLVDSVEFLLEVFDRPIEIQEIFLPIFVGGNGRNSVGPVHVRASLFYASMDAVGGAGREVERRWVWAHHALVSLRDDMCGFRMKNLRLRLHKGTYVFRAVSGRNVGALGGKEDAPPARFLKVTDERYTVKNSAYSVCGFTGDICAVTKNNILTSGTLCTISTGGHLSQSNSASYNGIMFDLRSKRNILLEEVFCVSQTTTDNVNVKVFWKEGSMKGSEKLPSRWKHVVSKDLYLADKQPFSAGPLNLQLRANQMYAIYINTASSCGVRFYNSSDGHVGDVGDEFEDDGVLTIYVGKKSESPLPFTEVPSEPRAIRGRITYRTFIQNPSLTLNQAVFPALKGFVVTRLLAALIAYFSDNPSAATLFEDNVIIESLTKLVTSRTNALCDPEAAGSLMCSIIRGALLEELRSGVVILPLCEGDPTRFSTLAKGDLAIVVHDSRRDLVGTLVRLIHEPDESGFVLVRDEASSVADRILPLENLLPIAECLECHKPFATTRICEASKTIHVPAVTEEEHLVSIMAKHFSQHCSLDANVSCVCARSLLHDPTSCIPYLDGQLNAARPGSSSVVAQGYRQTEYMISPDLLLDGGVGNGAAGFACPFVYSECVGACVSISFTPILGGWKIGFLSDFPLRPGVGASPRAFVVSLSAVLDEGRHQEPLVSPATCYLVRGCQLYHQFSTLTSVFHYSCMHADGFMHLMLDIQEIPLPPPTPLISAPVEPWVWANGSDHVELQPTKACKLMDQVDSGAWLKNKPRFWKLSMTSETDYRVFFLEVQVVFFKSNTGKFWGGDEACVIRRSFTLSHDERLNLAFTVDDDFVVYDDADNIRCHIAFEELYLTSKKGSLPTISIVNVGSHPVVLHLYSPGVAKMVDTGMGFSNWSAGSGSYSPQWVSYDPLNVKITKNRLMASCNRESGQAVIGSPLPMTGLSAFVLQIDRTDRVAGDSLGSGHFAGIVVSTFDHHAPHFGKLRQQLNSVWAVQDVYDIDSLPTQERIPPIKSSTDNVFLVGTKLRFLLDRDSGTLSLARDDESPRVVFHNIPCNVSLSPFVRLDHVKATATLTRFSCTTTSGEGGILTSPSKLLLNSRPITPTFLRCLPYSVVLSMFPVFRYVIYHLPSNRVATIEAIWGDPVISTRFGYRLSVAVQTLVELGAFSRKMIDAGIREIREFFPTHMLDKITTDLSASVEKPVILLPGTSENGTELFVLPDTYEVLGFVENTTMVRLMHFDENGPSERTLHVFCDADSKICMNPHIPIIKHSSIMHQIELVRATGETSVYGVITLGWYDCTLDAVSLADLDHRQQKVVAISILKALEHWHLHGFPHGHLKPENVYLRMGGGGGGGGDILTCVLWNVHCLHRDHSCASPWVRLQGLRDMRGDMWSCARILGSFANLLKVDTKFETVVRLMETSNLGISQILDQTGYFPKESKKNVYGPVLCLRTGARIHGGSGSYNGIMFDVVSKQVGVEIIRLSFFPDSTTSARVTLFVHDGSFMGVEEKGSEWRIVVQREMELVEKVETELSGFSPIMIPAGERVALFLHTTSGSGILFFSELDGVRADMAAVEEEDDHIGISVGKKSDNAIPFLGIQNQKRFLKGSISYMLSPQSGGYRNKLAGNYERVMKPPVQEPIPRPVFVDVSQPALLLEEGQDECLVYLEDGSCKWVQLGALQPSTLEASPLFERLMVALQRRMWARRKPLWNAFNGCPCSHQLCFHRKIYSNEAETSSRQQKVWWVSDPIETTCMVSAWQFNSLPDTMLLAVTSHDIVPADLPSMTNVLEYGHAFVHVDEWGRSVTSLYNSRKLIKRLRDDLLKSPLYLFFGPVEQDAVLSVPVVAFVTSKTDDFKIKLENSTTALVSISSDACFQKTFFLNGVMVNCSAEPGKPATFSEVSPVVGHQDDIRLIQLPPLSDERGLLDKGLGAKSSSLIRYLVETHSKHTWIDEKNVTLLTESQSLEMLGMRGSESFHHGPSAGAVTNPVFGGRRAHHVELLISNSIQHPVEVSFQHQPTNWCVSVPLPWFDSCGDPFASPSYSVRNIRLDLLVFPWAKRAFASFDGGIMYEVLPGLDSPPEFQLAFSLVGLSSSVRILRWRVLEKSDSTATHDVFDAIWSRLKGGRVSPNVSHSVGTLTRHSRNSVSLFSSQSNDSSFVSQIEAAIVCYARQLLGAVIMASKPSKVHKRLQTLLPFTSLRSDLVALEGLVAAEARRSSFLLIGTAYACLATPTVAQTLEQVETGVNVIYVSLDNESISPLFLTAYGPTLMLLLLRTATVYTRSIRHMALRCVLKLLKTPHCALPTHETLSVSFAPLLGMMNGLCQRGKMSSIVVQLGISIICEFIRRYQKGRPTLSPPGKKSAVPYAIATCIEVLVHAITSKPPLPLPEAFTHEPKETHRIHYEMRTGVTSPQGFRSSYAVFSETFRCTFGTKKFEVVLAASRSGNVVVGWDMDAVLPGSLAPNSSMARGVSSRALLPSCGYCIDHNGKVFVCLSRKKESQPLKIRARGGDILVVKCLYHEQAVIINLRRGTRNETATRFETYPNEMLALPVFWAEKEDDATFNGALLSEVSTGMDIAQLYNRLQEFPDRPDTSVIPQSYEFYAELAIFCQAMQRFERSLSFSESDAAITVQSHELASFPILSAFLCAGAFTNEVSLGPLIPYLKHLKVFDVLTSVFSVVVDIRRKTELFELWKRLKNICSPESSEKIQNETMRPFRNRLGNKANVVIHAMQARPSMRLGPYPTLMRSVFAQLFLQLQRSPIATFYASPMFTVKLAGFGSTDAGGPYRDILSQIAAEIMTTHPSGAFQLNPLFSQGGRGGHFAVMPNMAMALNSSQSSLMFEFFGKLLAECFVTKDLLAVEFPPLFWKFLLSEEIAIHDLNAIDPEFLRQLIPEDLMDRTADELEEMFPGIRESWMMFCIDNPQPGLESGLPPPNMHSALVMAEQIANRELHKYDIAMGYIQHGFDEVIPLYTLNAFRWQQVELMICGTPKLSYDALREVCEISLPANDARQFLDVIASMTDEDRMLLLRFTTGQTRLPLKETIKVQRSGAHNSLPTSSTCFFTLRLPSYSSADIMRERILYAIRHCKAIDTDGQAREHIILDN